MFINSTLTASEVWPHISEGNYKLLEERDVSLLKGFFSNTKANKILFHLETSSLKLRYMLAKRRIMYEWHILTRKDTELIKKIYQAMSIKSCKNDFSIIIQQGKEKYNILLSKEEISKLSK